MKKNLFITCSFALFVFLMNAPLSWAISFDLNINQAISFEDEANSTYDDTAALLSNDGLLAATITSTVSHNYYATGYGYGYFEAVSLNFDLSSVGYDNITEANLNFYVQQGSYPDTSWHHYQVLEGAFNETNEDAYPSSSGAPLGSATFSNGWVQVALDSSWIAAATDNSLDVTLRLWNARLDQVTLTGEYSSVDGSGPSDEIGDVTGDVTGNGGMAPVPEPSTMLLVGIGLFGLVGSAGRKLKKHRS